MKERLKLVLPGLLCLFLALGGPFHLSMLRLTVHRYHTMHTGAISSATEIRITTREFKESVSGAREVLVGTRWFDIDRLEYSGDMVILRGHFDDKEGVLRQLISDLSSGPGKEASPLLFQFYFNNGVMQQLSVYRNSQQLQSNHIQLYLSVCSDTLFRPPSYA